MPENALARKMKLKAGARATLIGAPDGYLTELEPLPADVEMATALRGTFHWIQIFARTRAEVATALAPASSETPNETVGLPSI